MSDKNLPHSNSPVGRIWCRPEHVWRMQFLFMSYDIVLWASSALDNSFKKVQMRVQNEPRASCQMAG